MSEPVRLTALPVQNADLLRALRGGGHATIKALAEALDRDASNVAKSLKALEAAGLTAPHSDHPIPELSGAGKAMVAALDRAEGVSPREAGVPHALIVPDLLNPRGEFDEDRLEELAASIGRDGLLQNLVVRPAEPMEGYGQPMHRLVAGERRWRAIGKLIRRGEWPADRPVPVRIKQMDDAGHAVAALLENLQREDLKPLEEARAFRRLIDDHGFKTAEIAARINASQRLVQQRLQLLELQPTMQTRLDTGALTFEKAREWLAQRPKPANVSPAELLMLAEIFMRIAPKGHSEDVPGKRASVGWQVSRDAVFHDLAQERLAVSSSNYRGEFDVYLTERGVATLLAHCTMFDHDRPAALKAMRAAAGLKSPPTWLSGACERDPKVVEEEQASARRREADIKARERADEGMRQTQAAETEAGRRALSDIRALEADANELTIGAFQHRFAALLATHEAHAPWTVIRQDNGGFRFSAEIHDAKGRPNVGWGPMLEARRRLIVLAINHAAGFRAFSGEPFPEEPELIDEEVDGGEDDEGDA